ncbi:MAG: presenilin family intramembrane aspartyl protease, partial [archaeon]|nr:presenilin family intramembrane aspartyl protease [archaeon]
QFLISLAFSFIVAILIVFFLMRIQSIWLIRTWFFIVVAIALGITLNMLILKTNLTYSSTIALSIGILLAYFKVFRKNIMIHNLTEMMIYPGIAVIFVTMLNLWTAIVLLILISIYDMWAVWRSGIMMKMAKYQINTVGFLGGFMLPYASKKVKEKILFLRNKYKNKKIPENIVKNSKIKVGLAILGGGDIVFPIIVTGVFFKTFNSLPGALTITLFSTLALIGLFIFGDKKKAYPAMPYLTMGILLGILIAVLFVI